MSANQLKLNTNTVVDELNLVNVVQRPRAIVIENTFPGGRNYSPPTRDYGFSNPSDFEVIDENKLSMFSYLVKREMKTKEWLSRFHLNHPSGNFSNLDAMMEPKNETNKLSVAKKSCVKIASTRETKSPTRINRISSTSSRTTNELTDLENCCDETIKSIEYLEQKLSEFKFERLKIVFNDRAEEEKQKQIQLGQLKYLSRSTYNSQMQLSKFKSQMTKPSSASSKSPIREANSQKGLTPTGRLCHTMRLVNKSIHAFADFYPYRPDNDLKSEKLCFHFYKQVHSCVDNFSQCIQTVFAFTNGIGEKSRAVSRRLTELLSKCDQYFDEFKSETEAQVAYDTSKAIVKCAPLNESISTKAKEAKLVNVVRIPRTKPNASISQGTTEKQSLVDAVPTQTFFDGSKNKPNWNYSADTRIELSPSRRSKKETFQKKKVKTATLYPSRSNKPKQVKKLSFQTMKKPIQKPKKQESSISVAAPSKPLSATDLSVSIESIPSEKQPQEGKSPIEHVSSPILNRKITITNRRPRSAEAPTSTNRRANQTNSNRLRSRESSLESIYSDSSPIRVKPSFEREKDGLNRSMFEYVERPREASSFKPILKNSNQLTLKTRNILARLDMIKSENEMIKRKYENLAYEQHLVEKFNEDGRIRRPYEECYAKIDTEEQPQIEYNMIYKKLRHPNLDQLRRVVNYAERFADYSEKTSITQIGHNQFDDLELFEELSKQIFDDCFDQVGEELETVTSEIASHLLNGELITENDTGAGLFSQRLQSFSSAKSSLSHTSSRSPSRRSSSPLKQQQQQDRSSAMSNYEESFISNSNNS